MFIRIHNTVIQCIVVILSHLEVMLLSKCPKRIELMERDILHFKGEKRLEAKKEYFRLLITNSKNCGLEDPIYLKRR